MAPVSVVIPCYKCANTIYRAIESVVNQTQKPAEVILVDDASNDETLKTLYQLAEQYLGWVKVIGLISNRGAANARNVGWDAASQPFIAWLDADDAWHPNKIEIQYKFMQENPQVTLSGHEAKIIVGNDQPVWPLRTFDFKYISKIKLLISNSFVTPSVMIKKDIAFRFDSTKRYMEDHLLWLQIVCDNHKIAKLDLTLVAMYKQAFGASGLSSHLWAMEKSDLDNYWLLYKTKKIDFISVNILSVYSLLKYLRRLLIVGLRRIPIVRE